MGKGNKREDRKEKIREDQRREEKQQINKKRGGGGKRRKKVQPSSAGQLRNAVPFAQNFARSGQNDPADGILRQRRRRLVVVVIVVFAT